MPFPQGRFAARGAAFDAAVVATVTFAEAAVTVELRVTEPAEKLQVLSAGNPEHSEGDRLIVPVKPFCAVNVRPVLPDWPGLAMLMLLPAVIIRDGGGFTVSISVADDGP